MLFKSLETVLSFMMLDEKIFFRRGNGEALESLVEFYECLSNEKIRNKKIFF